MVTPKVDSPENKATTRAFCLPVLHGVKTVAISEFSTVFLRTHRRFQKRRLQNNSNCKSQGYSKLEKQRVGLQLSAFSTLHLPQCALSQGILWPQIPQNSFFQQQTLCVCCLHRTLKYVLDVKTAKTTRPRKTKQFAEGQTLKAGLCDPRRAWALPRQS